jgi:hypothetical protein
MDAAIGAYTATPIPPRLPARQEPADSVAAAPAPEQSRSDVDRGLSGGAGRAPSTERSFDLDIETGSLVYQMVDVAKGTVIVQTPNDARLRLRAYLATLEAEAQPMVERVA